MKKKLNKLITIFLLIIGWFAKFLSVKQRNSFGKIVGDILRFLGKSRQQVTYENISHAFPDNSITENQQILINSYRNLGITLIELLVLRYLTDEEVKEYIKFSNIELLVKI